jgi:hypothetical protein
MTKCAFCEVDGHTITHCPDPEIPYILLKLRCKKWKAIKNRNLCRMFNWLHKQQVVVLRAILIHKYKQSIRTVAKGKLVAIIMEHELGHLIDANDDNAFWRGHLPDNYIRYNPVDHVKEIELMLNNISEHRPVLYEYFMMPLDELVHIMMTTIIDARKNRRPEYRSPIEYAEKEASTADENIEFECSICYDTIITPDKIAKLGCNHEFCTGCIEQHIRKTKTEYANCPLCRGEIHRMEVCSSQNTTLIQIL